MDDYKLFTYVCPKCLRYMSFESNMVMNILKPRTTCLNSPDGDFKIAIKPSVVCNKCLNTAIKVNSNFAHICFEMIAREYGINIELISNGDIDETADSKNREMMNSYTYNIPGVKFSNTCDNFAHLVDAINIVYDKKLYPTVGINIGSDYALIYSYGIYNQDEIEDYESMYKESELLNRECTLFIMAVINEMYRIINKNIQ